MTLTDLRSSTETTTGRPVRAHLSHWLGGILLGVAVGVATSFLQKDLHGHWAALANAASPWLAPAFAAGAVAAGGRHPVRRAGMAGAPAGLLACLGEVAGYYVATPLRGFGVSSAEIVLWTVCGALGGPVLGWAGAAWWHGTGRVRGIGAALLPATFAGEALGAYLLRLHHPGPAVLFGVLAVVALVVVIVPIGRPRPVRTCLASFVAATAVATLVYGPGLDLVARVLVGA